MAKNDSDFMLVLRSIVGDRVIPEALIAAIRKQWEANPNALIAQANAAKRKMNNRIISKRLRETPAMTAPRSSLAIPAEMSSRIDYKGPSQRDIIELRLNSGDMSMFSDFGRAFNEAKKRGQSEFNWRETGANPSGRFHTRNVQEEALYQKLHSPEEVEEYFDSSNFQPVAINPDMVNADNIKWGIRENVQRAHDEGLDKAYFDNLRLRMQNEALRLAQKVYDEGLNKALLENEELEIKQNAARRKAYSDFSKAHGDYPRFQQGGLINNDQELQKAFMAFLIEDAAAQGMQIQSEQDLQAYAQQLGEEGLKAKYQEFMQKMQGGVKAALGAKLNYIHKLKGNCPDGYEMVYMKEGGRFCPKCMQKASKAKDGKKLNENKNAIKDFKEKRVQKKVLGSACGSRLKKKVKKHEGGDTLNVATLINYKDNKSMNDFYRQKAEQNKVTNLGSFINEMIYRWKSNPSFGGLPENPKLNKTGIKTTIDRIRDSWNEPKAFIRFNKTESGIPYISFEKPSK